MYCIHSVHIMDILRVHVGHSFPVTGSSLIITNYITGNCNHYNCIHSVAGQARLGQPAATDVHHPKAITWTLGSVLALYL